MSVLTHALIAWSIICGVTHGVARAESEAFKLFYRGRDFVKAGNYAAACPLFERSMRLSPTVGITVNVADCWRKLGRLADALALLEKLKSQVEETRPDLVGTVNKTIDELRQQLAHVTIDAGALPEGTIVKLDGKPIKLGAKLAVDPKEHRIAAKGARTVRYLARAGREGFVKLEPDVRTRPREVYLLGGIGAGALLVGTITGVSVIKKKNRAIEECPMLECTPRGLDLLDSARALSHVTTALFVVGLGAAGAAGYLEWRSRRERPPIVIEPGPERVTVNVGGSW